jgi:hypothetical protein
MTVSPQILAAFDNWKCSELATLYASPCPEDLMQHLADAESQAFDDLMALPAANADDMLLKLYPIMLREMEPRADDPPLRLGESRSYTYDASFYAQLIEHLGSVSGPIAAASCVLPIAAGRQEASA